MKKNIALIGDLALNNLFVSDQNNNQKRFSKVQQIVKNKFTILNLETPIIVEENVSKEEKIITGTTEPVLVEAIKYLNIKVVSLANNHIGDYSLEGIKKTIEILDNHGVLHTGAGFLAKHCEPIFFDINGKKVYFLAYVDSSTHPKTESIKGLFINYFDLETVKRDLVKLKKEADGIILSIHWGVDYSYFPTKNQVEIAHQLIDCGVDVIMGHHTHTLQPVESYNDGIIFYSLGGLCYGDSYYKDSLRALRKRTKKGVILLLNEKLNVESILSTLELKYNYIVLSKFNFRLFSKIILYINRIRFKNKVFNIFVKLYESLFARVYEFFFGYYRKPLKELSKKENF